MFLVDVPFLPDLDPDLTLLIPTDLLCVASGGEAGLLRRGRSGSGSGSGGKRRQRPVPEDLRVLELTDNSICLDLMYRSDRRLHRSDYILRRDLEDPVGDCL